MKSLKSDFLKNFKKVSKLRGLDCSYLEAAKIIFGESFSGLLPTKSTECDALLLLSSYPVSEQQGAFRVENSFLYMCKNDHPALDELFEFMEISDSEIKELVILVQEYSVNQLHFFNLFRNDKEHDDLSSFEAASVTDFCYSMAEKSKFGTVVSHPAKMTNPNCRSPRFFYNISNYENDGFLRSGNGSVEFDLHINATQLVLFKFLSLPYKGRTVLDLVRENDTSSFSKIFGLHIDDACRILSIISEQVFDEDLKSDGKLRQVYFPVGKKYHLLSLLSPSGFVFRLKEKIDWINNKSPDAYLGMKAKRENKIFESGYSQILNVTETKHGW